MNKGFLDFLFERKKRNGQKELNDQLFDFLTSENEANPQIDLLADEADTPIEEITFEVPESGDMESAVESFNRAQETEPDDTQADEDVVWQYSEDDSYVIPQSGPSDPSDVTLNNTETELISIPKDQWINEIVDNVKNPKYKINPSKSSNNDSLRKGFTVGHPYEIPENVMRIGAIPERKDMSEGERRLFEIDEKIRRDANDEWLEREARKKQAAKDKQRPYTRELIDAAARESAKIASTGSNLMAIMSTREIGSPFMYSGGNYKPVSEEQRQKEVQIWRDRAKFFWELSKNPDLAAQNKDAFSKALNIIGENVPHVVVGTASNLVGGPAGAFTLNSLNSGNKAYMTAIDNGVDEDKAKAIGVGVGLISGAIDVAGDKLGGKYKEKLIQKATEKLNHKIVKGGVGLTMDAVIGAIENSGQELTEITGESTYRDINWQEGVSRTLNSMASGAIVNTTSKKAAGKLTDIIKKPGKTSSGANQRPGSKPAPDIENARGKGEESVSSTRQQADTQTQRNSRSYNDYEDVLNEGRQNARTAPKQETTAIVRQQNQLGPRIKLKPEELDLMLNIRELQNTTFIDPYYRDLMSFYMNESNGNE